MTHPMTSPTHYCVVCGARWRQNDDFSMSLRDQQCCDACNNAPVGGQLMPLSTPAGDSAMTTDRLRAAAQAALKALYRSQTTMRAPLDDWKGVLERKALDLVQLAAEELRAALAMEALAKQAQELQLGYE